LNNKAGADNAAIIVNGRRGICFQDEKQRAVSSVAVPHVLAQGSCTSRMAVLAQDNAFNLSTPGWTDNPGDVVSVSMSAPERLPLAVWMVAGFKPDAEMDVITARQIYNGMQCGIDFEPAPVEDRTSHPGASGALDASCADAATVKAVGFTPGRLNIFYIQEITEPSSPRGIVCSGSPKIVLIKLEASAETLAHEIGHVLTLRHSNESPVPPEVTAAIPGDNLMISGGNDRNTLTTGQCFRGNLNGPSGINTLGTRTGPTPGCRLAHGDNRCPALNFDVNPK